jgi:hypothetical protein
VTTAREVYGVATHVVDEEYGRDGHHKVYDTDDTSGEETDGTARETDLGKDGGGVVDNSVDTAVRSVNSPTPIISATVSTHPVHCWSAWAEAPSMRRWSRGLVVNSRLYSRRETRKLTVSIP